MSMKCGIVGIVGKANVGKSSLLNALIREKVSIVSPKPQTTRNNIIGILNEDECQIVFVDTPGIHSADSKLGDIMNKSAMSATSDVDALIVMIDGSKPITEKDITFVKRFSVCKNVILVISKTDLTTFERLYPYLKELNSLDFVSEIIPLSSHKNKNLDTLKTVLMKLLPDCNENELMFDKDMYTDKSIRFLVSEIVREKILYLLQEEIPHGIAVNLIKYLEKDNVINIACDIICEKDNHKQIILGRKGEKIKEIGTQSRLDIEKLVGKSVYLELFVKVIKDWKNKVALLTEMGYNNNGFEDN